MSSYGQYTKHYFANERRVSSRVGGGLPQGADAPHTTQLPSGRSWYDRAVAMKEQMERAFECADMTQDRLEFATAWGIEKLVGNSSDGEAFFYHQNHQGSPVFVSTASGYLTEQQLLQAYREVFASAQNAASWRSPYSFTGKEFDAESGLHYFGARYYLSSLGVWLSTDPLADQFANMSPYAYAANNPALFTDRWGLAPDPPAWWTQFNTRLNSALLSIQEANGEVLTAFSEVIVEISDSRLEKQKTSSTNTKKILTPWMKHAMAEYKKGIVEIPKGSNKSERINEYLKYAGVTSPNAWCGAYAHWSMGQAGIEGGGARGRDWLNWGVKLDNPAYGAVAVFKSGHVGFVAGLTKDGKPVILHGNWSDKVSLSTYGIPKTDIREYRYPKDYSPASTIPTY